MAENQIRTIEAARWTGRDDGEGEEHQRWYNVVYPSPELSTHARVMDPEQCATVFLGFSSDEGVRRNKGRQGAAAGPAALRQALAGMSLPEGLPEDFEAYDAGDVVVEGENLEDGQAALGETVAAILDSGNFPVVFGGGHEIAYGTYLGLAVSRVRGSRNWSQETHRTERIGILNLDAHFDLRDEETPSSGTPFRQMLDDERRAGTEAKYAVIGISQPSNTRALFRAAEEYGVDYLTDDECVSSRLVQVKEFVDRFLSRVNVVYLTIDLDVLPAAQAPGVSAPAAYGVDLEVIQAVCDQVAASGKLAVVDVAELNPSFDVDGRTARSAARLVHRIATHHRPITPERIHG